MFPGAIVGGWEGHFAGAEARKWEEPTTATMRLPRVLLALAKKKHPEVVQVRWDREDSKVWGKSEVQQYSIGYQKTVKIFEELRSGGGGLNMEGVFGERWMLDSL